jgi:hypothetical protein
MSGVFQNIDPPPPNRPASVYPPAFGARGGHMCTRWVAKGVRSQYFGRRRHSSVLYICKHFVGKLHVPLTPPPPVLAPLPSSMCHRKPNFDEYGSLSTTTLVLAFLLTPCEKRVYLSMYKTLRFAHRLLGFMT